MHLTKVFLTLGLPERTRTCGRSHQHPGLRSVTKDPLERPGLLPSGSRVGTLGRFSPTLHTPVRRPLYHCESLNCQRCCRRKCWQTSSSPQQCFFCGLFPLGHIWKKATKQQRWVFPEITMVQATESRKKGGSKNGQMPYPHPFYEAPRLGPGKKTRTEQNTTP